MSPRGHCERPTSVWLTALGVDDGASAWSSSCCTTGVDGVVVEGFSSLSHAHEMSEYWHTIPAPFCQYCNGEGEGVRVAEST